MQRSNASGSSLTGARRPRARGRRGRAAARPTPNPASLEQRRDRVGLVEPDLERDQRHPVDAPARPAAGSHRARPRRANSAAARLVARDLGRAAARPSATYGRFASTASQAPPSEQIAARRSATSRPRRARVHRAPPRARRRLTSIPITSGRAARPSARARPRRCRSRRQRPAPRAAASARPRPAARSPAAGSGRARSTAASRRRKSLRPRMYATGSRATRRASSASYARRARRQRRRARRVTSRARSTPSASREQQLGVEPRRVAAGLASAAARRASASRIDVAQPPPRQATACSSSRRRFSSSWSASVSSSSSPIRIPSRLWTSRLIRWSLTRRSP